MKRKLSRILTVGLAAVISLAAVPVNAQSSGTEINMEKVGGYSSGMSDADGGVMEIIAYNSSSQYAYAVNGKSGKLAVIPLNGEGTLTASEFDVKAAVNDESFVYGDMTSVDVSPNGELLAAAVQAEGYADSGKAVIFKCNADGSLEFLKAVDTGVQPDMVVFADNSTILTADEGEPREGYGEGTADPKGSVTVINLDKDTSTVVDFTAAMYALGKVPEKVTAGGGSSVSRYTVRFDTDGAGSIPNQTVKKNGKAEEPAVPVKEGYIFTGWYTDKELTEKYDFNSDVVKGMTLYAGWEKKPDPETGRIVLTIGEKSAEVFGKTEYSDTAPFIRNDRTMTPARFVAEALGARVQWNEAERTVTVTKDGIEIVLTINSDTAIVNGNNVRLDSPAVIENNRTYTPARFIGETLGAKVEWDAETRRVIITK